MNEPIRIWLRDELKRHTSLSLAVALAQTKQHAILSFPALGFTDGLLDSHKLSHLVRHGKTALQPLIINPPPLMALPQTTLREMWTRHLTAHLLTDTPFGNQQGKLEFHTERDPKRRFQYAEWWAQQQQKPLIYVTWSAGEKDWLENQKASGEHLLIQDFINILSASSKAELTELAALKKGAVVIDGLHRLAPRGLTPVHSMLEDSATLGMDILLTGAFPHPLQPNRTNNVQSQNVQHRPLLTDMSDLINQLRPSLNNPEHRELILLPSRKAVLETYHAVIQSNLPQGIIASRSKTGKQLAAEAQQHHPLTIATWGSALLSKTYDHTITSKVTWPLLAEASLRAKKVTVLSLIGFPPPNTHTTAVSLTRELLEANMNPLDDQTHWEYWDELLPVSQTDSRQIQKERLNFNFRAVSHEMDNLFDAGVRVLVSTPHNQSEVANAIKSGYTPIKSSYNVRMTHDSIKNAVQTGDIMQSAQALIWVGNYDQDVGVGTP